MKEKPKVRENKGGEEQERIIKKKNCNKIWEKESGEKAYNRKEKKEEKERR